ILPCPCPMRARLVVAIIRILPSLRLLPAAPTATSTLWLTAVLLFGNLRARPECLPAPGTPPLLHQCVSAQPTWAASANNQPLTVWSPTQGSSGSINRTQFRGSLPVSTGGSNPVSAKGRSFSVFSFHRRARACSG